MYLYIIRAVKLRVNKTIKYIFIFYSLNYNDGYAIILTIHVYRTETYNLINRHAK